MSAVSSGSRRSRKRSRLFPVLLLVCALRGLGQNGDKKGEAQPPPPPALKVPPSSPLHSLYPGTLGPNVLDPPLGAHPRFLLEGGAFTVGRDLLEEKSDTRRLMERLEEQMAENKAELAQHKVRINDLQHSVTARTGSCPGSRTGGPSRGSSPSKRPSSTSNG